jgi:hypothetical protein
LRATGGDKSGWRRCSPAAGLGCDSGAVEVVVDDGGREKLPHARAKSQRWFVGIVARRCGVAGVEQSFCAGGTMGRRRLGLRGAV